MGQIELIDHTAWPYFRFSLGFRNVGDLHVLLDF